MIGHEREGVFLAGGFAVLGHERDAARSLLVTKPAWAWTSEK